MSGRQNKLIRRNLEGKKPSRKVKKLLRKKPREDIGYREGGEGFIKWVEDYVYAPIYPPGSDIPKWIPMIDLPRELEPDTGRCYMDLWIGQKKILRKALRMRNGRFIYRLVVFCWMRGEGKSFIACLIQLWRFFCWQRQKIMLGANSKDQVKFVHYDIMRDIILNSPGLLSQVGKRNIQEKEIRLKDADGNVVNLIRSISSFSGIVSNITGYTFSEIFDMKNPKFYVQLDGSIRDIPNAMGVIDSTVSDKGHVLYDLYEGFITGKLKGVFFSHRESKAGASEDFWNPHMDEQQLRDYEVKFPFGEFERYFKNTWEAGRTQGFSDEMILETEYLGMDGALLNHEPISEKIDEIFRLKKIAESMIEKGLPHAAKDCYDKIRIIESRMTPVSNHYRLVEGRNTPKQVQLDQLEALGEVLDTNWAILAGIDMADPMSTRSNADTILTITAKGLPGSKSSGFVYTLENAAPLYVYFLIRAWNVEDHSLEHIKELLDEADDDLDGIDILCGERWGIWDMQNWCEERSIRFEAIQPTYDRQKEGFKAFHMLMNRGLLKAPPLGLIGTKGKKDIFREQAQQFEHNVDKKWFGSPEKKERHGIQDDFIYAWNWAIYGGRMVGVYDFRERKNTQMFGMMIQNRELIGSY